MSTGLLRAHRLAGTRAATLALVVAGHRSRNRTAVARRHGAMRMLRARSASRSARLCRLRLRSARLLWPCLRMRCSRRARGRLLTWGLRTKRLLRRRTHGSRRRRRCGRSNRARYSRRVCGRYRLSCSRSRRSGRCWGCRRHRRGLHGCRSGRCRRNWSGSWCCGRRRLCRNRRMRRSSRRRSRWLAERSPGRRFLRGPFGFGGGFCVGNALQVTLYLFGDIGGNRTGVGLLLGYAKTCQQVNDGFRLDLQLAREFIDADLGCVAHAS